MTFRIRERLAGFTAFGQTLRSVRPIRLAISGIIIDGVSRQASRIIPDVCSTLSRQASGGIHPRCDRILEKFNRDTAGSFGNGAGIGDFLDTALPGINISGPVADFRDQRIARDGFLK